MFRYPVRTAKKTRLFTITDISCLMLFNNIIAVYGENHTKVQIENGDLLIVNSRWVLRLQEINEYNQNRR